MDVVLVWISIGVVSFVYFTFEYGQAQRARHELRQHIKDFWKEKRKRRDAGIKSKRRGVHRVPQPEHQADDRPDRSVHRPNWN